MRAKRRPKQFVSEINVVPYIDVMLVLLVIFMVTAPLLQQGVAVDLPQASANPIDAADQEPLVISVDSTGNYYLNVADKPNSPIASKDLQLRVAAELKRNKARQVLVKGDLRVSYGQVMGAMVLLQKAGAPSVGLVTQDNSEQASVNNTSSVKA